MRSAGYETDQLHVAAHGMELLRVSTPWHIETIRSLFQEYATSLDFDLCFQNFAAELADLPGDYAPPSGCLLLAERDGQAVGCIALRPLPGGPCEMKRLYVRPGFRGLGIGRFLVEAVLAAARRMGYREMFLDTVVTMRAAQALYESLGFVDMESYYHNPLAGTRFMGLTL